MHLINSKADDNSVSGYYHTKASVREYIEMAKDINGKELIDELKQHLPLSSRVLEIGSGPGTDWKILSQKYEVIGSDNSLEFLNHLKNTVPAGDFRELDAVTLTTEDNFDGIYSNKVLHHLTDDELIKSIERQYELLNEEGVICHSFWKGEGSEMFKGLYVNYHSEGELRRLLEPKFKILVLQAYAEFEESDSLFLIARKSQ